MGIKERRTKILLALFLLSDVDFKPVVLNETLEVAFDISLNQKTKGTISTLLKEGSIDKISAVNDEMSSEASSQDAGTQYA